MNKPRFNLKNKTEKETLIVMVLRHRGERFVYSTGLKIPTKFWNDKSQRARVTQDFIDHCFINESLDKIQAVTTQLLKKSVADGDALSQFSFKSKLDGLLKGTDVPANEQDFLAFFDRFIEERLSSPKYSKGSIQVYKNCRNHVSQYVRGKRLKFEDLSLDFLKGLRSHLFARGFMDNHINKIISTLRTVLNEATELGLNSRMDYKSKRISVAKTEVDNIYLTEEELDKLATLDLTNYPGLSKVRDLFLVGAYTGLRFSDFSTLKSTNIQELDGKPFFNVLTEKTEQRVWIPVHPKIMGILEKYGFSLPESISNQKTNEHLKELARLAGLTDIVTKRAYQGGRVSEQVFQKWQLVSTHTARRSFATNAYRAGVPHFIIMRITGHKRTEMFMRYIKFDNKESAMMMANHSFFADNSTQPSGNNISLPGGLTPY